MKTMKYILGIVMSTALLFSGCMKEDIDELRRQQAENADRIAALEAWQATVNGNISSLQQLVGALENMDNITGIVPFETPAPGGYKITFTKSGEATIWNGAKGDSPVIGIAQDTDDKYYWTLDGDWLLGGGNKIPATGATPKVAIGSDGFWYVSADGTATGTPPGAGWTVTTVKAQGTQGPQGDAIFAANGVDHTTSQDNVVFTLADGTTKITVPKYKSIGINFTQPGAFIAGQEYRVAYTSTGTSAPTDVRVTSIPNGWAVSVDKNTSEFVITPPADFSAAGVEFGKAIIWLDNGNQIAAMYNLELLKGTNNTTVGDYYYENGVVTGLVYILNDGTMGSGLVVSIDEKADLQWSDFHAEIDLTTNSMEKMKVIEAYIMGDNDKTWANFPAFEWVHTTKNGGTADYSDSNITGVWYLPGLHDLQYLLCVMANVQLQTWSAGNNNSFSWGATKLANSDFNKLFEIAGGTAFNPTHYWTSNEESATNSWYLRFDNNAAGRNDFSKNNAEGVNVRAILAF